MFPTKMETIAHSKGDLEKHEPKRSPTRHHPNVKTIETRKVGEKMRYKIDWSAKGTKLKDIGIIVAPEIFRVSERIYLPNGRVVVEGTKYFSWGTARNIIASGHTPAGWRMMTLAEAEAIQNRYNNSNSSLLVLGFYGLITPNNMAEYSYNPERGDHLVISRGQAGYFWTDGLSTSLYPYVLENTGLKMRTTSFYISYGLPLILVKNI